MITISKKELAIICRGLDFAERYEGSYLDAMSDCVSPTDQLAKKAAKENIKKFKKIRSDLFDRARADD